MTLFEAIQFTNSFGRQITFGDRVDYCYISISKIIPPTNSEEGPQRFSVVQNIQYKELVEDIMIDAILKMNEEMSKNKM